MTRIFNPIRPAMLAAASMLSLAGTPAAAQELDLGDDRAGASGDWGAMVTRADGGHLLGNPQAEARLVEFMSYTCSHCANFANSGEGAIKLLYVPTGKVALEVRHLIRDPIDLTAALAAQCGTPDQFFGNHEAIMLKYPEWMAKARAATQAQTTRWRFGSFASRAQAIASDLDFYEIMEPRGFSRTELDRCLTDDAKANAIAEQSRADIEKYGLRGTPTFLMGDTKLDAHDWDTLQPHLDKLF